MGNNKSDFVKNLLKDKTINLRQREKIFDLVARDFVNSEAELQRVFEEIEVIKEDLYLFNDAKEKIGHIKKLEVNIDIEKPSKKSEESNLNNNLSDYINPRYLYDFLLEYNQNPILKYTCHTIDDNDRFNDILRECQTDTYQFDEHLKIIHRDFQKLSFKYRGRILKNIIGLISTYLGTYHATEGWSENIKIKWTSMDLKLWCIENPGKVPNPLDAFQQEKFRFQTIQLKNGNSLSNFSDLVIYFKHLFHIKNSNPLKPLIEASIFYNFIDDEKYKFLFDDCFSQNIDLFTYSEALIQAFNKIIKISRNYYTDEILVAKLYFGYDENNFKEFKIAILNSKVFGKNFMDFRPGDDLTSLINNQINGLCEFYIQAFFEDKNAVGLVNVWNGRYVEYMQTDNEIEGVEFILKMY